VRELIAIAQAKPGQLNHASVATQVLATLAYRRASMAKIDFAQVLYKGSPRALNALSGSAVLPDRVSRHSSAHIKTGRIRALGVGASQRIAALPDVPTIAETLPGYEARGWNAIFAPARTPKPVIDRLNREIVKIVHSPAFSDVLVSDGATAVGNTSAELDAVVRGT
jgi:tripartite-type tricarboxylate transporter receptor subunit TctC